jgi:pyruvyltransferase
MLRLFSSTSKICLSFLYLIYAHSCASVGYTQGIPLYFWQDKIINFGDYLSLKLVERIVGLPITVVPKSALNTHKLLAVGSILTFARNDDMVWGSGVNGKWMDLNNYKFTRLTVRAVRGPLTRNFIKKNFNIECPEIYGDPALLVPYFFPEFKRKDNPAHDYVIIPHYSEQHLFSKDDSHVIYPTEPWDEVIQKILDSKFVISSSLHGIIIAEAFGIPAQFLRISEKESLFKYHDYYLGTGRTGFTMAYSVEEALALGGESPVICDLTQLYNAFPFECWPHHTFQAPFFQ